MIVDGKEYTVRYRTNNVSNPRSQRYSNNPSFKGSSPKYQRRDIDAAIKIGKDLQKMTPHQSNRIPLKPKRAGVSTEHSLQLAQPAAENHEMPSSKLIGVISQSSEAVPPQPIKAEMGDNMIESVDTTKNQSVRQSSERVQS